MPTKINLGIHLGSSCMDNPNHDIMWWANMINLTVQHAIMVPLTITVRVQGQYRLYPRAWLAYGVRDMLL